MTKNTEVKMLSDACFEVANLVETQEFAALESFEDAVEHYAEEPFDYPFRILQALRYAISDVRGKRLSIGRFIQVVKLVQEFFDTPPAMSFYDSTPKTALDEFDKQIERIIGKDFWFRWQT